MSYLKFSDNLFLGVPELNRLYKFIDTDGFRNFLLQNAVSFGLVENEINNLVNAKVEAGTNVGTIKHSLIRGIDSDGLFFTKEAEDNIVLPDDDAWYWIKVSHAYSALEEGTVNISTNGTVTGTGTKFTEVLRSQPNFPSKIQFPASTVNTLQYEVTSIVSDTNLILSGTTFTAETNLKYRVVGTFAPDAVPPTSDLYPFQYDISNFELVAELSANTKPAHTAGKEFFIYRVKRNGSAVTIQDKRTEIFQTRANYFLRSIDRLTRNPLCGTESIRFDNVRSTRTQNIVKIGWGFRSTNWTTDVNANRLTLVGGQGGIFKTTADFTDGDFDGWRVYTQSGRFYRIKQSSITSDQINLDLDVLEIDDFGANSSQELVVVPNVEEITIIFEQNSFGSDLIQRTHTFPIQRGYANIPLEINATPTCTYVVKFKYKSFKDSSPTWLIRKGTGYYTESSFEDNGAFKAEIDRVLKITTTGTDDGIIELVENSKSHTQRIESLDTGDRPGYEFIELDNGIAQYDITVGNQKTFQHMGADAGAITLTQNHIINLKTEGAVPGNFFYIYIDAEVGFDDFDIEVRQDYVNVGDTGTLLHQITESAYESNGVDGVLTNKILLFCQYGTGFPDYTSPIISLPTDRWNVIPLIADAYSIITSLKTLNSAIGDNGTGITGLQTQIDGNDTDIAALQTNVTLVVGAGTLETDITGNVRTEYSNGDNNAINLSINLTNGTGGTLVLGDKIATLPANTAPLTVDKYLHAVATGMAQHTTNESSPAIIILKINGDILYGGLYDSTDGEYKTALEDGAAVSLSTTYLRLG